MTTPRHIQTMITRKNNLDERLKAMHTAFLEKSKPVSDEIESLNEALDLLGWYGGDGRPADLPEAKPSMITPTKQSKPDKYVGDGEIKF